MNNTIKEIFERKSVRSYKDKPISKEDKELILNSSIQAPTAGNMTLYTILDITDQEKKDRLAITCDNQPFIAKAPMVLIFCADYRRWYQLFGKFSEPVRTPGSGDMLLAMADAIIAAQNAVVAAESLGIGSCYIGDILENYEIHKELLNLPKYVIPACMLCFGYPTDQQKDRDKPARFLLQDIVHENSYNLDKTDADAMEEMVNIRHGEWKDDNVSDWTRRFCERKWNSEFSEEMTRSCDEIIKSWIEK